MILVAIVAVILAAIVVGLTLHDKTTPTTQLPRLGIEFYDPYGSTCLQSNTAGTHAPATGSITYAQLNSWAIKSFESARGDATTPAFTGMSVSPQQMMCSIVESVFNTIYAPTTDTTASSPDQTSIFFQQANRDDCNIAAVAAVYSTVNPQGMISLLSRLYWKGTISTNLPKPREYALGLNDPETSGWKQGPAMFVSSVGLRDAMNVQTLSQDKTAGADSTEMRVSEAHSHITAKPVSGGGTQGGNGASYFAVSGDVAKWTEWLMGSPTIIQGTCTTEACKSILNGLLPAELVSLKTWFHEAFPLVMEGKEPPLYTGWSKNVQRKIDAGLMSNIHHYFHPVSNADLTGVCKQSNGKPVYLGISSSVLPGGGGESSMCQEGTNVCVLDHWVVLQTEGGCGATCTVWSWGSLYSLPCAKLAAATTTIIHDFS